jgi:ribonuclease E
MRRILIAQDSVEVRVAVLQDNTLWALQSEGVETEKIRGNIYKARVVSVEKGLDAAFVDFGLQKHGFLPLNEVSLKSLRTISGKVRARSLGVGDYVLVQVQREEFGHKGALVTMNITLPGRFLVLMPFSERSGVSRKLSQEERARLRKALKALKIEDGFGVILRTCSAEAFDIGEVQSEIDELIGLWRKIVRDFNQARQPTILHKEERLHIRFLRDFLDSSVSEVVVEGEQIYHEVREFVQDKAPQLVHCLRLYKDKVPLFSRNGVETQAMALLSNRVDLPSGGSIVIAQTEALWAIDVNSGRTRRRDIEETAFLTNMEAAREIARQIVLRDMGGLIVVDFIDMDSLDHREQVRKEIEHALRQDKARLHVSAIGDFGLLVLSRQRLGQGSEGTMLEACTACNGTGKVEKPFSVARRVVARLREGLALQEGRDALDKVTIKVHPRVATDLFDRWRDLLLQLEKAHHIRISVYATEEKEQSDFEVLFSDRKVDNQRQDIAQASGGSENRKGLPTADETHLAEAKKEELRKQKSRKRRRRHRPRRVSKDITTRGGGEDA